MFWISRATGDRSETKVNESYRYFNMLGMISKPDKVMIIDFLNQCATSNLVIQYMKVSVII